jgi:hypothetical protein
MRLGNGGFRTFVAGLSCAALLAAGTAQAATIVIVNNDGAGEGFNDPTAVAPVGGNPGVTRGQQRLNVFQAAANIWGALLPSAVTIRVQAQFNPQTCTSAGAVLGSAGPVTIQANFAGAPFAETWYHVALANRLAGVDLSASNDINATFNSNLGTLAGCPFSWYYGLDGNEGSATELLPVVLHELGHGLGFSTTTSGTTGNYNTGRPSIFDRFMYDSVTGLHWNQMTAAQRVASAISCGKLSWDGPSVRSASNAVLGPKALLRVTAPPAAAGDYEVGTAAFGPPLSAGSVTGEVVLYDDGVPPGTDACEASAIDLTGKIALVDRGTCPFIDKVLNAQTAGAIGVIVADNAAGCPPAGLGGSLPAITIPSVRVTLTDGAILKANLVGQMATLLVDPSIDAGTAFGNHVKMYTPNPFQSGSSVSHFDVSAEPNILMEPAINPNLSNTVDLTLNQMSDIGWLDAATAVNVAPGYINVGDDGVRIEWFTAAASLLSWSAERTEGDGDVWTMIAAPEVFGQNKLVLTDPTAEPGRTYGYRVSAPSSEDGLTVSEIVWVTTPDAGSASLALEGALPNPAVGSLNVAFTLSGISPARLDLVNVAGRSVGSMDLSSYGPGRHIVNFAAGRKVAAGTYFLRVTQNGKTVSKPVVIVH